jgi:hypothetical protein
MHARKMLETFAENDKIKGAVCEEIDNKHFE